MRTHAVASRARHRPAGGRAHERQADQVAARFLRGETQLARYITPAPAAGFALASSPGIPLAAGLRSELEQAFGADLGAVRLHTDPAAASAAASMNALAFASGPHLYFASEQFRPGTPQGRKLLAHEMSHVLQQSGRTAADGCMAATPATGTHAVQRQPSDDPNADDKVSWLADGKLALSALIARHLTAPDVDDTVSALTELVERESGGQLPMGVISTIGLRLIQIAKDGFFIHSVQSNLVQTALTAPSRSFLLDCLKVCGREEHFEAAAALLDADSDFALRTAYGPRTAFREFLAKPPRGEDWAAEALKHPPLKRFWWVFFNTFQQFVLNPFRPPQTLYGFAEAKAGALKDIHGSSLDLLPSDRVILGFELLELYDKVRVELMAGVEKKVAARMAGEPPAVRRLGNAYELHQALEDSLKDPKQPAFWLAMQKRLKALAWQAVQFWQKANDLYAEMSDKVSKAPLDKRLKAFVELDRPFAADDPLMAPLRQVLGRLAEPGGLFFFGEPVPSPSEYEKRIRSLEAALDFKGRLPNNFLLALQMALLKAYGDGKLDSPRALALGWVLYWCTRLSRFLAAYAASRDDPDYEDGRLTHRLVITWEVLLLAQVARWPELRDAAAKIALGKEPDRSYIAVAGQWHVEERVPIGNLLSDFADEPLGGFRGLHPSHVAAFFQGQLIQSMAATIEDALQRARSDPKEKLDTQALNRQIEALPRPWRVVPDDSLIVLVRAEDRGKMSGFDFIKSSPKSLAELKRLANERALGADARSLARSTPPRKGGALKDEIFAWIVPDPVQVVGLLRNTEPFKTRMTEAGYAHLADADWLEQLLKGPVAGKEVLQALDAHGKGQHARLEDALRQLTALVRRLTSRRLEDEKLKPYVKNMSNKNFGFPRDVYQAVVDFGFAVDPRTDDDVDFQTALLLLSLGPALENAFSTLSRAIRLPPLFHELLTKAIAKSQEMRHRTRAGATDAERKPVEAVLFRNDVDPARSERLDAFLVHEPKLVALAARMEQARLELQEESGFGSYDGVTLMSLRSPEKLEPGARHAMEIDGNDWELVEVYRKFTYHPKIEGSAATSRSSRPIYKDEKGEVIDPPPHLPVAEFLVNGTEKIIYADDDFSMGPLSDAIFWHTLSIELGELADTLEGGAMLMIDIIELIPGAGQKMMLIRLAAQMLVFAKEIPELVKALKDDPVAFIGELAAKIASDYLRPETILLFFLLGDGPEPFENDRKPRTAPKKVKATGKLARAIGLLRRLGMRLADAVRWLRLRVSGPAHALQSSIVTRPKLAWLLRQAVDVGVFLSQHLPAPGQAGALSAEERVLAMLIELVPEGSAEPPPGASPDDQQAHYGGLMANIEKELKETLGQFRTQLDEVLGLFQEAELPKEIVPLQLVMEWMLDFFISRLGAKVRIARRLLENTQEYKDLRAMIGKALAVEAAGTPADPNVIWRDVIVGRIDEQFREARNGLVEGIHGRVNAIAAATGLGSLALGKPVAKKPGEFGVQQVDYPLAELASAEGEVPARGRLAQLPETPGQPLAARVRLAEERRFGHDFTHVRLHTGAEAAAPLEDAGARALTTGSHVFLRPGLDPNSNPGARILRHELTHVLQQTGPRPLGKAHATRPVRGRRGGGVSIDAMREAAAEAMAKADEAAASQPAQVSSGAEGIQPDMDSAVSAVLNAFTTFRSAEEFKKESKRKVPGITDASNAWGKVFEVFDKGKPEHADFVTDVIKLLAAHLTKTVPKGDPQIVEVARLAQKPAKGARGKDPKNTELDFDRFVTLLEGFLLARTGVGMQIKLSGPKSPKLKSLMVTYVHFGVIAPTSPTGGPLWDAVMKATPGLMVAGEDQKKLRLEIHARLQSLGPDPFIWKTGQKKFRFSEEFVEAFGKTRVAKRKPSLESGLPEIGTPPSADPNVEPPAADKYLNPSGQKGIGLRIGPHKGQSGTDRESHHMTQYLLVQYFRNHNTVKAWKNTVDYPGIHPGKGNDRKYFQATGKKPMQLEDLDKGSERGGGMPAILISADLHRRGRLHIDRKKQWDGKEGDPDGDEDQGGGQARQGYAIERVFKAALRNRVGAPDDEPAQWKKAVQKPGADLRVYEAMKDTYHWMHAIMLPALERGLVTRELAYYRGIAARSHTKAGTSELEKGYDLKATDLRSVYARAIAYNDATMATAGWPKP